MAESYAEIVEAIKHVPVTYLPALLITIVEQCVTRKVFVPGGLETVVRRAMEKAEKAV